MLLLLQVWAVLTVGLLCLLCVVMVAQKAGRRIWRHLAAALTARRSPMQPHRT